MRSKIFTIAMIALTSIACMRSLPDRRAVQWSDAIVRAKLLSVDGKAGEVYSFTILDSIDGLLKSGEKVTARDYSLGGAVACPNAPTADDINKPFLLLLRSKGQDPCMIVNISPVDPADVSSRDAFKELVQETRKAEAGLTDDAIHAQAQAYADAQDDTEAEQAEKTLREMGYKAVPQIRRVMSESNDIGKQRLAPVIKDLTPPDDSGPTTQP